jgi:hypothetical protein
VVAVADNRDRDRHDLSLLTGLGVKKRGAVAVRRPYLSRFAQPVCSAS